MLRQARHGRSQQILPIRSELDRCHDEDQGDEAEQRHAFLDQAESALPKQEPDNDTDRNGPPLMTDPGCELAGERDAADLGREHHQVEQNGDGQRQQEEVEAEPLAHGVGDRVVAHSRKAAAHLHQHDDA
jgi:hypothetical protein